MICSNYDKTGQRCTNKAEFLLFSPDGKRVPGGRYCRKHTEEPILEYQEKLGQEWFAEKIDDLGNIVPLTPIVSARFIQHFRMKT